MTGKADPGETPAECAAREAFEETGLRGELVDLGYAHRYRGKKGMFEEHAFLLRAPEDAAPVLSGEHVGYRWTPPHDARSAVHWRAHVKALDLALKAVRKP